MGFIPYVFEIQRNIRNVYEAKIHDNSVLNYNHFIM